MDTILFTAWGYEMSLLELTAVITGLAAVWFAARGNILTWLFAIINALLFFILFYKVSLYSAMALQLFFFSNAIYGWFNWRRDRNGNKKPVTLLDHKHRVMWTALIIAGSILLGLLMKNIHELLPGFFPRQATFVFTDAMIAVMSIAASLLLARLKLENWVLWILINVMSIVMYSMKGVMLVSVQYVLFLGMAAYGLAGWKKELDDRRG